MSDVRVFDAKDALLADAAAFVGAAARDAISTRGVFTVALTGGSVAKELHPVLASTPGLVDWTRTKVWFGDERAVAPTHEDSNFRLARETLLDRVSVAKENVFRMRGEDPDLDWASRDYAKTLPERFDLIFLGMGPDGHVCSLFPGFPQLSETERLVVPVEGSPKPPPRRMTVTPPVLHSARALLTIALSADKADAVARALADDGAITQTPARLAKRGTWMLTRDAAAKR
ncbi:MAG TPA: 6-phosphogluconolactonase [bacterium]|nr:6-phosphogluconolactonase [bacterium]